MSAHRAADVGVGEVEYRVAFLRYDPTDGFRVWAERCYRSLSDARDASSVAVVTGEAPDCDAPPPTPIVRAVTTEATVLDVRGEGPR